MSVALSIEFANDEGCVSAEASIAVELKLELEEISTSVVGLKFSVPCPPMEGGQASCTK